MLLTYVQKLDERVFEVSGPSDAHCCTVAMTMNKFFLNVQSWSRYGHLLPRQYISTYPRRRVFHCSRLLWTPDKPTPPSKLSHYTVSNESARILPVESWVDCLPARVRPYLYLTRIDKPIGTSLLFYPCGTFVCDVPESQVI